MRKVIPNKNLKVSPAKLDSKFLEDIHRMKRVLRDKLDLNRELSDTQFTHLLRKQPGWEQFKKSIDLRRMESEI